MKAWLLDGFQGLGALRLANDVPLPIPGVGEVCLRVHFAALNPADRFLAENLYPAKPALPHILGRDAFGTVESVGAGVTDWRPGDRAAVLRGDAGVDKPGTLAEFVAVPAEVLVAPPDGWEDAQCAAAPLVYLTAHQALNQWGALTDATVLITGASGGVGVAALHLAKAGGHRVIALSRSVEKSARLRELGADLVLDPADPELKRRVREYTAKKGVDLIVDNIAGELFNIVLDTLGFGGRLSVVGMLGGTVPEFQTAKLIFRRIRIGGVAVHDYKGAAARTAWTEIVSLLGRTSARPLVDSVFPFAQLKEAFARLAAGPMGKVVVQVSE